MSPLRLLYKLLDRSKSWSIRTQLLAYFLVSLTIILALINAIAVLNLSLLKDRSVEQVKAKAKDLVEQDILTSAGLMGKVVGVYLESGLMLLATVQEALIESLENTIIGLTPLQSYLYTELPLSCMLFSPEVYGSSPVCISSSSYMPLSTQLLNSTLLERTAQLDYLLPGLGSVSYAGALLHRLVMYYETYSFLKVFPGTDLPYNYNPQGTPWYQQFVENGYAPIATSGYSESIGANLTILSLVFPLMDNTGTRIGVMSMDIAVSDIYGMVLNTTEDADLNDHLSQASVVLVSRDNQTLPNPYDKEWSNSEELDVSAAVNEPQYVHTMDIHGKSRQVAAAPLPDTEDWWYALVLLLPSEAEKSFDHIESRALKDASLWVLLTTAVSSLLVLGAVSLCIVAYAERLTAPLRGVTHFAKRLPNTPIHKADLVQLEELEEGENNVQQLVRNFKRLVSRLMERPAGPSKATRFSRAQKRFPHNELYNGARWHSALRHL